MTILSIDYDSINSLGGVSTFNRNLSKVFGSDIKFATIYRNNGKEMLNEMNLGVYKNTLFKGINYLSGYRLFALYFKFLINKEKPDVVIINSPSLVRHLSNEQKLILVQHTSFPIMMKNKANFRSKRYFREVLNKVDAFVLLSPEDKKEVSFFLDPALNKKLNFIRHMYPLDNRYSRKRSFDRSLVIVGRLDIAHKRLDLAVKAMVLLPNWSLTIYGEGADRAELEKIIKKEKLTNVYLAGMIKEAPKYMVKHDIHIMTSDIEGYGLTNIEAMACGLPLIIRNTYTAAADLIKNNGVLLGKAWDVQKYISALLEIENNYEEYSKGSLLHSEQYRSDVISEKWQKLIERI